MRKMNVDKLLQMAYGSLIGLTHTVGTVSSEPVCFY